MDDTDDGAAGGLNPEIGDDRTGREDSLSVPVITVFSGLQFRQLLIVSVFVLFFDIIQIVCEVIDDYLFLYFLII